MTEADQTSDAVVLPAIGTAAQMTFATITRDGQRQRATPRQDFLDAAGRLLPWADWLAAIQPHYPAATIGRPRVPLDSLLRLHLVRCCYRLDEHAAAALAWNCPLVRAFAHIDLMRRDPPSPRSLRRFNDLLKQAGIDLPQAADNHLAALGLRLTPGEISEPAISAARAALLKQGGGDDA